MRSREAARGNVRARLAAVAAGTVLVTGAAACGEEDFANEPRPPAPIEVTAAIDDRSVSVSPREFGAGLVTITISNQTAEPVRLVLEGPSDESSDEIVPGGTGSIKADLAEGEYEASAGDDLDIRPQTITVGPERESSQNDLLLP